MTQGLVPRCGASASGSCATPPTAVPESSRPNSLSLARGSRGARVQPRGALDSHAPAARPRCTWPAGSRTLFLDAPRPGRHLEVLEIHRLRGLDLLHAHYALPVVSAFLARAPPLSRARAPRVVTTLHGRTSRSSATTPYAPLTEHALRASDAVTAVGEDRHAARGSRSTWRPGLPDRGHPQLRGLRALPPRCRCAGRAPDPGPRLELPAGEARAVAGARLRARGRGSRRAAVAGRRRSGPGRVPPRRGRGRRRGQGRLPGRARRAPRAPGTRLRLLPDQSRGELRLSAERPAGRRPGDARGGVGGREDGVSGLLCDADDLEGYARVLRRALSEPELVDGMGQAARTRASEHFSFDRVLPRYEELYRRVLAEAR